MIRPTLPPLLLCWSALLNACASGERPPEVRLVREPLPAVLLMPLPRPTLPPSGQRLTQGQVAELLIEQDAVIDGYEGRLAEIARLNPRD